MESTWAIITANELTRLQADPTNVELLFISELGLILVLAICSIIIMHSLLSRRVEQRLLEHVKSLHVNFLKDEH